MQHGRQLNRVALWADLALPVLMAGAGAWPSETPSCYVESSHRMARTVLLTLVALGLQLATLGCELAAASLQVRGLLHWTGLDDTG